MNKTRIKFRDWLTRLLVRSLAKILGADAIMYGFALRGGDWLMTRVDGQPMEKCAVVDCEIEVRPPLDK